MKIGMMSFAHMHAYSYADGLKNIPNVELVGIFDEDVERGQEAPKNIIRSHYSDQAEFLALEMDAVIICSENNRHKEMVVKCCESKETYLM